MVQSADYRLSLPLTDNLSLWTHSELGLFSVEAMRHKMAAADAPAVRALVVDDNRDAAEMMALLLGLEGHEVATAYDGASSIAKVLSFQPNLVLLDIGMPNLDGYDVARRIQTLPLSPRPFLVAVTGDATLDDTRRSAEAGFDLHVRKPVFPDVFEGLVQLLQLSSGTVRAREMSAENRHAVTSLMLQHVEMANLVSRRCLGDHHRGHQGALDCEGPESARQGREMAGCRRM